MPQDAPTERHGRPPLPDLERRGRVVSLRVTVAEYDRLDAIARKSHTTIAQLFRQLLLSDETQPDRRP